MHPRSPRHPLLRGVTVALIGVAALLAACEAKMPTAAQVDRMDARSAEVSARSMGLVSDSSVQWFVNGVATSAVKAKQIIADSIATVEVSKAGGRSRISIVTKGEAERSSAATNDSLRGLRRRVGSLEGTLRSQPAELQGATPILIVDDKRVDPSTLKTIDRARIATVNVLKGASAVSQYGPEAKNGVIVVRTKPAGAQ